MMPVEVNRLIFRYRARHRRVHFIRAIKVNACILFSCDRPSPQVIDKHLGACGGGRDFCWCITEQTSRCNAYIRTACACFDKVRCA